MHERLKESILKSPILRKNGYPYIVHPVTDGIPCMEPEMLTEIIDWMIDVGDFDCDLILAPESMGIPLAVPLSLRLGIPYAVIRKRKYSLPGEIEIKQHTGYSESSMYINGTSRGQRIAIVDDVISTGNTLSAIIRALKDEGVEITDVVTVFDKGDRADDFEKEFGMTVKTMMRIWIENGKPVCSE